MENRCVDIYVGSCFEANPGRMDMMIIWCAYVRDKGQKEAKQYESSVTDKDHEAAEMGQVLDDHGDHETLLENGVPGSDRPTARQPHESTSRPGIKKTRHGRQLGSQTPTHRRSRSWLWRLFSGFKRAWEGS